MNTTNCARSACEDPVDLDGRYVSFMAGKWHEACWAQNYRSDTIAPTAPANPAPSPGGSALLAWAIEEDQILDGFDYR